MSSLSERRLRTVDENRLSPKVQLEVLQSVPLVRDFEDALSEAGLSPLNARRISTVQVNVGKLCNQVCKHCHVEAGPHRTEVMLRETFESVLKAADRIGATTIDITGGAPELNANFEWFVRACRERGYHVINRCNLTVLLVRRFAHMPEFFAEHDVEIVASLPHYRHVGTDAQRGEGVFEKSIEALRKLNAVGYGMGAHTLTLATNPVGAFLPGSQSSMEREWKRELLRRHGVHFDRLIAITNLPVSRYLEWLDRSGNLEGYLGELEDAFNPLAASEVMCRDGISVGYDGRIYDCDFNQMLELAIGHVDDLSSAFFERQIQVGRHCFGCTAGAGSSCGGQKVGEPPSQARAKSLNAD